MNFRMVFFIIGQIMKIEGFAMICPLLVGIFCGEYNCIYSFGIPIAALLICGFLLTFRKPKNNSIYAKEGFVSVAFAWIFMSIAGGIPFFISGDIPSIADCFFETVSGFTTTGATILTDIDGLSKANHFWRAFTHWIGGMGILVFALAVLSHNEARTMHIMRAECAGPKVGRIVSKSKSTARILYIMYFILTVLEVIFLMLGGMPLFDSVINSFSTAGTGGFSIHGTSIAYYNSTYIEIVISIFMILFGVNFNLYYLIVLKKFSQIFKDEELRTYLGIIFIATAAITLNIYRTYENVGEALLDAFFQVSSTITSTGFATVDFTKWPVFSQTVILMLMFVGACAGSTGGGLKVSRVIILFKTGLKEIKYVLNPRSVVTVKLNGKAVENEIVRGVSSYAVIFTFIFFLSWLLLSLDNFDVAETFSAVTTCINNIGPGLGRLGPSGSFAGFSNFSKYILSFDMLIGRLEIYPLLMIFSAFKK